jgi:DNA-3-methyladenine glycosylase
MWGAPGHAYVYFIYGAHFCFNAVCRESGVAEAVLVRAVEPTFGVEIMQHNRRVLRERDLTNGPAKLCAALQIDGTFDGADLCNSQSSLFIAHNPLRSTLLQERGPLVTTTRVGITKAAELPLRFYLDGSAFVSKK